MFDKDSIDKEAEQQAIAISKHRELRGIDVRRNGKVSRQMQRQSNNEIIEKRLFGG